MSVSAMPHPVYFLVMKTKRQGGARFTAIKDENTGERFACVFVSAQDAEEFMVANDLTFDHWKISQIKSPVFVQSHCDQALSDGICEAVINPPPLIRGAWRTLPIQQLATWSRTAKEPLLVWVDYKVRLKKQRSKQKGEPA